MKRPLTEVNGDKPVKKVILADTTEENILRASDEEAERNEKRNGGRRSPVSKFHEALSVVEDIFIQNGGPDDSMKCLDFAEIIASVEVSHPTAIMEAQDFFRLICG